MKIALIPSFDNNYNKRQKQSFITPVPQFSNISFTSNTKDSFQGNCIKEINEYLKFEISNIFQIDRNIINEHYLGNIDDKNKFSKYGYYTLNLEEKSNLNIRKLNKNYEVFYNKNLKSLYDVGNGTKEYSEISLENNVLINSWFNYFNLSDIKALNHRIREEYKNENLDNLIKYSIINDFNKNCRELPIHKVKLDENVFTDNILSLNKEDIKNIFIVINDYIDNSSQNEYSTMYGYLNDLSDGIYNNNYIKIADTYRKIINIIQPFYENNHRIVELENIALIKNFQNSENYKILNRKYNLDLLFKTEILSNEEKIFLINKKDENYGTDLYKFLIDNPTNNKTRKQIINNLIIAENADKQAFNIMKKLLIDDINSGNITNINSKLLDLLITQTFPKYNINLMSDTDKVKYLQKFPDEELNFILEKIKIDWLKQRAEDSFEFEANKYDINTRFDKLTENMTIKIDDVEINLSNTVNKLIDNLSKQLNTTENSLGNLVIQHDKNMVHQFYNQNRQMEKITELLCSNTKEADEIQKQISLILDKIEQYDSKKKNEVDFYRIGLRKLSGLASLGYGAGRLVFSEGTDVGGLISILYGLNMIL